mmetsp:Transcript_135004/g.320059  ORF Transcript_135004/g.320059 Transcript_135004/m.320059 type:complete len:206 (-) Transcript_135004:2765-3382(-)
MFLLRNRCPLHLLHAPHSRQSPSLQSRGGGMEHSFRLHSRISASDPMQALPPLTASTDTLRVRECMPPSQLALQVDHAPHNENWQSAGGPTAQPEGEAAPTTGLQVLVSLRFPTHQVPWPRPKRSIRLLRRCKPSQVRVHSVHKLHEAKRQSTGGSQSTSVLQNLVSLSLPSGSFPQALASSTICLCLKETPPPQVAEHMPHSVH